MVKRRFVEMHLKTMLLFCAFMWIFCDAGNYRVKRKIKFTKSSKLFFRLNGKDNVVPWNQIFAHGWGFRVNWELPETIPKKRKFFKRDVHDEIENIPLLWGHRGYSCLMRYICDTTATIEKSKTCGMLCEIGRIISRSKGSDADFFRSFVNKCDMYEKKCPFSLRSSASSDVD